MPQSNTLKTIRLSLILGKGTFSEEGNTVVVEGLATTVSVKKPGLPDKNSADVAITGLKLDTMAQLTMLAFRPLEAQKNKIRIEAGDLGETLSLVYAGDISEGYADFNSAPDPVFKIKSETGYYAQQIAAQTTTIDAAAPVADVFANLANDGEYAFKNEGVTGSVKNVWLPGSPIDQMRKLARDEGIDLILDDDTVVIMPAGQAREAQGNATLLTKDTGLIGYPSFNKEGVVFRCLYDPSLKYGGLVSIESIVPRASGTWKITKLTHDLTAYDQSGGPWETKIEAAYNAG